MEDDVLPLNNSLLTESQKDHFPKKNVLDIAHNSCISHGIVIGSVFIGYGEGNIWEGNSSFKLVYPLQNTTDRKHPIYISSAKTSPWKGWRMYDFVELCGTLTYEDVFTRIMSVDPSVLKRCGFKYYWRVQDCKVYIYLSLKESHIYNCLHQCPLVRLSAYYHSQTSDQYSSDIWNISKLVSIFQAELDIPIIDEINVHKLSSTINTFQDFFESLELIRNGYPEYEINTDGITSSLLPYQKDAVRFMIHRELNPSLPNLEFLLNYALKPDLYYYPSFGCFINCKNTTYEITLRGGILADEMGLGKTVELLALIQTASYNKNIIELNKAETPNIICPVAEIVNYIVSTVVSTVEGKTGLQVTKRHRKNQSSHGNVITVAKKSNEVLEDSSVRCEQCELIFLKEKMHWNDEYALEGFKFFCPSFVPQVLLQQWYEEIYRHIRKEVVVDVYSGVANECYKHSVYLSKIDIVICSYETLGKELQFVDEAAERYLRKRSYFMGKRTMSPLLTVKWWRICLDESQVVESRTSKHAYMCSKLLSHSRWCITGTPLMHSINDIFGLISFLNFQPFSFSNYWNFAIWRPWTNGNTKPMLQLISQIFWRNSKRKVASQLELHSISYKLHNITFSPLEERLYSLKLREARAKIRSLRNFAAMDRSTQLKHLKSVECRSILNYLHSLRLSIVTGDFNHRYENNYALPFTPEALFCRLFEANKQIYEEKTRQLVSELNGLAALCFIWNVDEAGQIYRRARNVVKEMDNLKEQFKFSQKAFAVDTTQRIHIAFNYLEWLSLPQSNAYDELNSNKDLLESELKDLYNSYQRKELAEFSLLLSNWGNVQNAWNVFDHSLDYMLIWLLIGVAESSYDSMLAIMNRAQENDCFCVYPQYPIILYIRFRDLLIGINESVNKLRTHIGIVFDLLQTSSDSISQGKPFFIKFDCSHKRKKEDTSNTTGSAHLGGTSDSDQCSVDTVEDSSPLKFCSLCSMYYSIRDVCKKFGFSNTERDMNVLNSFLYRVVTNVWACLTDIEKEPLKYSYENLEQWFEACRDTLQLAKKLDVVAQEFSYRHNEIEQACYRLMPGNIVKMPLDLNSGLSFELKTNCDQNMQMLFEAFETLVATRDLERNACYTKLSYLRTLRTDLPEDIECPVCYSELKAEWRVFPCAHLICCSCYEQLKKTFSNGHKIRCVNCREVVSEETVALVERRPQSEDSQSCIPGYYLNIKFNAVIREIKEILNEGPNKILLFSSLIGAMEPLSKVLSLASIAHCRAFPHNIGEVLDRFKADEFQVLIMPLSLGSHGLNLTDANHVLFLEPPTNASVAAQAVARVHRLGQRQDVTIHNFIVKGSIEAEIYKLGTNCDEDRWTIKSLFEILGI